MLDILYGVLKYFVYFLITFIIYMIYVYVYQPHQIRNHYKKFPNVYMSKKYNFFVGDFKEYLEDIKNGNVHYHHKKAMAEELRKYDMMLELEGIKPHIKMISTKAFKEMETLIPAKIDRVQEPLGFGKIILGSFGSKRSSEYNMRRRKNFIESLSLNSSSKYIPSMLKCLDHHIGKWKKDDVIEVSNNLNLLTFTIFILVLFGDDMEEWANNTIDYEDPNGEIKVVELRQCYIDIIRDHIVGYLNPISSVAPSINRMTLINPFKRNRRNILRFRDRLGEVLGQIKDPSSIYKQLTKDESITSQDVFEDLLGFMIAGTETSSHNLSSVIYFMKKSPEVLVKVREELSKAGLSKDNLNSEFSLDKINELNYLTYVIKEALRLDPPAYETLFYQAYDDVTICEVFIPRGTQIRKDLLMPHLDPNEWQRPLEFLPERFDPEDELFYKPGGDKKPRGIHTLIPFAFGKRSCPGQSFAMLEIKVVVAYLVTHLDYEISKDLLDNPGAGFGIGSIFKLPITISEVY